MVHNNWLVTQSERLTQKRLSYRDLSSIDFVNCDTFKSNTSYSRLKLVIYKNRYSTSYQQFLLILRNKNFCEMFFRWTRFSDGIFHLLPDKEKINFKLHPLRVHFHENLLCSKHCTIFSLCSWMWLKSLFDSHSERTWSGDKKSVSCVYCLIIIVLYG